MKEIIVNEKIKIPKFSFENRSLNSKVRVTEKIDELLDILHSKYKIEGYEPKYSPNLPIMAGWKLIDTKYSSIFFGFSSQTQIGNCGYGILYGLRTSNIIPINIAAKILSDIIEINKHIYSFPHILTTDNENRKEYYSEGTMLDTIGNPIHNGRKIHIWRY